MSTDVRQEIRELAEFHQSNRKPVELHEVEGMASSSVKLTPGGGFRGPALAVAVMASVLVVVGGLALLVSTGEETSPADTVTPTTSVVPTTAPPAPSTTLEVDSSLGSGDLVWQRVDMDQLSELLNDAADVRVIDGGDRFVLFVHALDAPHSRLFSSVDGSNWRSIPFDDGLGDEHVAAAWEDTVLVVGGGGGWSREENGPVFSTPSRVSVIRPDGSVERQVLDGDVLSAAIGPAGMFVTVAPHGSYGAVIDQVLGRGFSDTLYEAEIRDGILFVRREPDGETAEIVLSEHGLTEDDLNSPVTGWYSLSGTDWSPVPDTPSDLNVVATSTGFIGVTATTAWHSKDGTAWSQIGEMPGAPWQFSQLLVRWQQGAVATDLKSYIHISADGITRLPDPPIALSSISSSPQPLYVSGDSEVIIANPVERELLVLRADQTWRAGTLPDDMSDSFGWFNSSGAVTGQAVLLLLWEEETPGGVQRPVWWLGTHAAD